jgi:hypothetical protein
LVSATTETSVPVIESSISTTPTPTPIVTTPTTKAALSSLSISDIGKFTVPPLLLLSSYSGFLCCLFSLDLLFQRQLCIFRV